MDKNIIYVIGHKSPDTDTICSAIAYSEYLKSKGVNAVPARQGDLNAETKYVLDYWKVESPVDLDSIKEKEVVLVDHNEKNQSPEGIDQAKIIEIIDHHKISFSFSEPIKFQTIPLGATASIIAQKMIGDKDFKISNQIAGILISAILSDTVVFKSSTCTQNDKDIVNHLNQIAEIENLQEFGIEIKKQKSNLKNLSAEQIIRNDFKIFESSLKKFGVGQIEVVDTQEANERKLEILEELNKIAKTENLIFTVLMITDIINQGSELLISEGGSCLEDAFGKKIKDSSMYLENVMSRKKDLIPSITKVLENT